VYPISLLLQYADMRFKLRFVLTNDIGSITASHTRTPAVAVNQTAIVPKWAWSTSRARVKSRPI
jgi:hypothetical protein